MKANELRIGNWVNNNEEYYQITSATIAQLERGDSTAIAIPLTDEWLNKFGFENGGYDLLFWRLNEFELAGNDFMNKGEEIPEYAYNWYLDDNKHKQIVIHYVHQLQNLYFALTNEELTITQ